MFNAASGEPRDPRAVKHQFRQRNNRLWRSFAHEAELKYRSSVIMGQKKSVCSSGTHLSPVPSCTSGQFTNIIKKCN